MYIDTDFCTELNIYYSYKSYYIHGTKPYLGKEVSFILLKVLTRIQDRKLVYLFVIALIILCTVIISNLVQKKLCILLDN